MKIAIMIIVVAVVMITSNFVDWLEPVIGSDSTFFEGVLLFLIACINYNNVALRRKLRLDE